MILVTRNKRKGKVPLVLKHFEKRGIGLKEFLPHPIFAFIRGLSISFDEPTLVLTTKPDPKV
jgi:hypothetical protein